MSSQPRCTPARPRGVWRLAVGVTLAVAAVWLWLLRAETLRAGHPAYPLTLLVLLVVGLGYGVLGARDLRRAATRRMRRRGLTTAARLGGGLAVVVVLSALVYLVPFSATPAAIAATTSTADVRVTDSATRIVLTPTSRAPSIGLVYQPGARVDPRAYVPLLERVASAGYLVVVVKQPWGIGFTAIDAPSAVIGDFPDVARWAVGGHSLGGVAAASYAASTHPRLVGLVLWASYPASSLASRTGLDVCSISGTRDGLTTPAAVASSKASLPRGTTYTAVEGGVHGYFGDYGVQPGDGTPTTDRASAQTAIVAATVTCLASMATAPGS